LLVPLQLALSLALAAASYRFVERPFRTGAGLPSLSLPRLRPALAATVVGTVVLVGWGGFVPGGGGAGAQPPLAAASPHVAIVRERPPHPAPPPVHQARRRPVRRRPLRIVAYGDSVMAGAEPALAARLGPRFSMNARVGRQAPELVALVDALRRSGARPDALVIHLGDNGPLDDAQMAALHRAARTARHIYLLNDHAPVSWLAQSNAEIEHAARTWPHTTLIDWNATVTPRPELLWDGIHLKPEGAALYARTIARAVRSTARRAS
ncbi:MAG TPA: hypothetical protein VGI54_00325, partial [Solirubrobacteraceae bacterium]